MSIFTKNFNKEGRGVSKNEPEKKEFFRFFELYFRNFWMLLIANLWYILLSVPIVTSGLANVGMTYICRMAARDKHVFLTSDFFGAIKRNWKRALPLGIINVIITLVFAADMYCLYLLWSLNPDKQAFCIVILAVSLFVFCLYSFAKYYQYLLMITFDYKLGDIFKNSVLFATLGIKHNIIIGGVTVLIIAAVVLITSLNFAFGVALCSMAGILFYPAFRNFLIQFNAFPEVKRYIIDPYYKEHPDEDIEKRRDLGIYEEKDNGAVFDDTVPKDDSY